MMETIRRRQHIAERMPGNIVQTLNSQNRSDIHLAETREGERFTLLFGDHFITAAAIAFSLFRSLN